MEYQCIGFWLADKASLLLQMTKNPFTSQLLNASELMRGLSPAMVRQVLPLLDQLTPIYTDLAQGRLEFTPEPEETKRLIRTFYGELLHTQTECRCSVCAIRHSRKVLLICSLEAAASDLLACITMTCCPYHCSVSQREYNATCCALPCVSVSALCLDTWSWLYRGAQ